MLFVLPPTLCLVLGALRLVIESIVKKIVYIAINFHAT